MSKTNWHRGFVKFVKDTTDCNSDQAMAVLGRVIDICMDMLAEDTLSDDDRSIADEQPYLMDVSAGTRVDDAIKEAVSIQGGLNKRPVVFSFNGILVCVDGTKSTEEVLKEWEEESESKREEYKRSEEYKERTHVEAVALKLRQRKVDELLSVFIPVMAMSESDIVSWVGQMAEINDHIGLDWDKADVACKLERFGYERNKHVGQPPAWFQDGDSHTRRSRMAQYLIGQTLDCLHRDMPIHPQITYFVDEYKRG